MKSFRETSPLLSVAGGCLIAWQLCLFLSPCAFLSAEPAEALLACGRMGFLAGFALLLVLVSFTAPVRQALMTPPPQLSDSRRHRSAGAIRCRPALSAGDHSGRLGICCHRLCAGRCRLCLPVSRVLRRSFRSIPRKPNTIGISLRDSRRGSVPPLQQSSCTNHLYGAAAFAFCSRAGARPKRELPK